ncbi:putative polysaccharide biosynthesis protein [Listeria booriae]|uniref:Cell division protein n=1 Tax=Listeria booriae TaxID=1552123 RepID=A0A099VXT2_9LIST|nr:polysaccharide biosynthesis protein [Listeria booriae]KGL38359.1 cell division protein [Listeria booriae]MBC1558247.1 polysaccharide biosynthesis protein [Listeria booriae]MBC1563177.1 polysaccharide biosynthesis protein [Listeria booriae]MBC1566625.1 polysaccharide biosynthesis protein [Listeria booriae]MBC1892122.1 polysaccharide biosynthesis protein [Listeria booriae]
MSSSKLLRGTFILTLGTFISKFLGLFYVIPFYWIMGGAGPMTLYNFGYVPYQIFLGIATAGVPLAVAKYVAKYNAIGEYEIGRRLFRTGVYLMLVTGILSFIAMYALAPVLAGLQSIEGSGYTVADVTTVIRAVSFALIVIPVMSLIRGFFQGYQSMGPSAVSQVIEQIVRIAFLLAGSAFVLYVIHGTIASAISLATFAAFIGALASLICLLWYFFKRKKGLDALLRTSKGEVTVSLPSMYKDIFITAIPFVVVGIASSLYQQIDQFTFGRILTWIGYSGHEAENLLGIVNFSAQKLVIIPVSLATAFSMTIVPLVTAAYMRGEQENVKKQLNDVFQVLLFITLPACIGMSLLAEPLYTVFYEHDPAGIQILAAYAPVAILLSLFSVTAAILQGIDQQRFTILSLLLGLLTKSVFQMPLMMWMGARGSVMATGLGYTVSVIFAMIIIRKYANYNFSVILRRTVLMLMLNLAMAIVVLLAYYGFTFFINPESKFGSMLLLILCGGLGAIVYSYLSLRLRLFDKVFGPRAASIRRKLHIKA